MQTQTQPLNNATADKIFAAFPLEAKTKMLAYGASNLIVTNVGKTPPAAAKKATAAKTTTPVRGRPAGAKAAASAPKPLTPLQTQVLERIRSRGSAGIQQSDIVLANIKPNSIGRALTGLKTQKLVTSRGTKGNLVWFFQEATEQKQQAA
jgi:hypothetical protein